MNVSQSLSAKNIRYSHNKLKDLTKQHLSNSNSFILASQARQVFYVKDPSNGRWSVVVKPQEKSLLTFVTITSWAIHPSIA